MKNKGMVSRLFGKIPLLTGLLALVAACQNPLTGTVQVESVSISPASGGTAIAVGGTVQLAAVVQPDSASDKSLTWSSESPAVAIVSGAGLVTGVSPGAALIKAVSGNGKTGTLTITVSPGTPGNVAVTGVSFADQSINLAQGATRLVDYTVSPDNATDKTVSVSSSDTNIAEAVLEGTQVKISAKSTNGTAKITITTTDGAKTAELNVTVSAANPLQGITLNPASLALNKNAEGSLRASLNPEDTTTDPGLTWTSSDTSVAEIVGSGKTVTIKAKGKGGATITVKSTEDPTKTASCNVTVSVPLTGLTLSESSLTLNPGGAASLTVSPLPADADLPASLGWESSDTAAVTVSPASGATVTVTAAALGNATITVSGGGGITASCTVNVTNEVIRGLTVEFEGFGDEHIDLTVNGPPALSHSANNAITVIPPAGYESYSWRGGGIGNPPSSDPQPVYISAQMLEIGTHEITLICVKNNRPYSKTLTVSVGY